MMLIIYHGEPVKVNIYSGTAVCEVNTKKDQFQEFTLQIVFWLQNITCGFIIICDWQHLGKLKISWFHFSEQSFWYASNCAKFSLFIKNSTCSNFETFTSTNTLIMKMLQIKNGNMLCPMMKKSKS